MNQELSIVAAAAQQQENRTELDISSTGVCNVHISTWVAKIPIIPARTTPQSNQSLLGGLRKALTLPEYDHGLFDPGRGGDLAKCSRSLGAFSLHPVNSDRLLF